MYMDVAYCTARQTMKDSSIYKHIIYSFILRRRRLCVVGIHSESVRTYLSSGVWTLCVYESNDRRTHMTGMLEWPAGLSFHLRDSQTSPLHLSDQRISPLRLSDQWVSSVRLSDHWISAFSPKLQTLYCLFSSHAEICTSSLPHVFSVYGWLSELTHFRFFR